MRPFPKNLGWLKMTVDKIVELRVAHIFMEFNYIVT